MKITIVRHAETEYNHKGVMQGNSNYELNEKGRRECKKLREELKDVKFDYCYMSPLLRAVETAFILVGDRVETFPDKRLIERDLGDLEGHPRSDYDVSKYWNYDLNSTDLGVEGIQSVFARAKDFLDYVIPKHQGEHILVVSHSSVVRAMHHLLHHTNLHNDKLFDFPIKNCYCETIEVIKKQKK